MLGRNDFKYILKRVLIYLLIALLMFIFGIFKAKAYTVNTGQIPDYTYTLSTHEEEVISITNTGLGRLENKGKGTLYFSLLYYNTSGNAYLNPIIAVGIDTGNNTFQCDIGNQVAYNDEGNKKNTLISAVCPVDFTNTGVRGIRVKRGVGNVSTSIVFSSYMTLLNDTTNTISETQSQTTAINNAISSQTQQLLDRLYNNQVDNQQLTQQIIANQNANQQQSHQDAQNINNSINDTTPVSNNEISGNTSDWSNNNLQNGTITQLVTLPITLIQAYLNGINSSCSQFNLGSLFGTDLILPCINVSNYIGTALWSTIDILFSGFMILNISRKLIKIFNDFTNLNSNQAEELYGGGA